MEHKIANTHAEAPLFILYTTATEAAQIRALAAQYTAAIRAELVALAQDLEQRAARLESEKD